MRELRQSLLTVLPVCGFALFFGAHVAEDLSLIGATVASVLASASVVFFLAAMIVAFLRERPVAAPVLDAPGPPPRVLARDVLNDPGLAMTLPQRIEAAIALSKMEFRTLGILSIRIGETDDLTKAVTAVRESLRATDRAIVATEEILVCLPMIVVRSDLDAIAARLSRIVARTWEGVTQAPEGAVPAIDIGIAMSPIDGLRATQLIEAAQANACKVRALRLGRPATRRSAGHAPVTPRLKPAHLAVR